VIVPAYNAERTLGECLGAIRASVFEPLEVIVVDDGSTDRTSWIAESQGALVVGLDGRRGAGYARNAGSRVAGGDILAFVDSDVMLPGGALKAIGEYFASHPEVLAVTGRLSRAHPNRNFASQFKNLYMHVVLGRMPRRVDFLYGSIFAVRRRDYMGMTEGNIRGEDTDLGQKMTAAGKEIHLLKDLEVVHLKEYTLLSLLQNDFWVPYSFARALVRHSRFGSLLREQRFSHASRRQNLATVFTGLVPVSVGFSLFHPPAWPAGLVLLAAAAGMNADLYAACLREKGWRFAAAAVAFSYVDMLVMLLGVLSGLLSTVPGGWAGEGAARRGR